MPDSRYHQMFDRLVSEVTAIHQANQQRIHKGLWGMVVVLVLYLTLLFVTQGSKVIILLLWIMTMFALAAYLIAVEYLNHELKKKLEHITQMELDRGGRCGGGESCKAARNDRSDAVACGRYTPPP